MSFIKKIESKYKIITANSSKALNHYFVTMLWSSTDMDDEDDEPLDKNYDIGDISEELKQSSKKDLDLFYKKAEEKGVDLSQYKDDAIGHNFWLTRNGHGAGFWDSNEFDEKDRKTLTEISKTFNEVHPYAGDDGKIYAH